MPSATRGACLKAQAKVGPTPHPRARTPVSQADLNASRTSAKLLLTAVLAIPTRAHCVTSQHSRREFITCAHDRLYHLLCLILKRVLACLHEGVIIALTRLVRTGAYVRAPDSEVCVQRLVLAAEDADGVQPADSSLRMLVALANAQGAEGTRPPQDGAGGSGAPQVAVTGSPLESGGAVDVVFAVAPVCVSHGDFVSWGAGRIQVAGRS